ncbi:hypothetical protein [Flavicella marina]|uniref:hypothetical protein n=1 Tax=Flavicella marina TaxID=1475951 RepID=UPI0012646A26|nr:hypothetical protein [Flavicella marina]
MRNLVWIVAILVGVGMNAQSRNDLKGPAAKNYKPWQHKTKTVEITSSSTHQQSLRSHEHKNYKPWKDNSERTKIEVVSSNKHKLRSPEAKNYKPWNNNQFVSEPNEALTIND